jgi:hypothetical protein
VVSLERTTNWKRGPALDSGELLMSASAISRKGKASFPHCSRRPDSGYTTPIRTSDGGVAVAAEVAAVGVVRGVRLEAGVGERAGVAVAVTCGRSVPPLQASAVQSKAAIAPPSSVFLSTLFSLGSFTADRPIIRTSSVGR